MPTTEETKKLLQDNLAALQAERAVHIEPLDAARAARDGFLEANAALFEQERALAREVKRLQADPRLTELDKSISATAQALGGFRMSSKE